jgi:hypothetical protein
MLNTFLILINYFTLSVSLLFSSGLRVITEVDTFPVNYSIEIFLKNNKCLSDSSFSLENIKILSNQLHLTNYISKSNKDNFNLNLKYNFNDINDYINWFNEDSFDIVIKHFKKYCNRDIEITRKLNINRISTDFNKYNDYKLSYLNKTLNIPVGYTIRLLKICKDDISLKILESILNKIDLLKNSNSLGFEINSINFNSSITLEINFSFINKSQFIDWNKSLGASSILKYLKSLLNTKEDNLWQYFYIDFQNIDQ